MRICALWSDLRGSYFFLHLAVFGKDYSLLVSAFLNWTVVGSEPLLCEKQIKERYSLYLELFANR